MGSSSLSARGAQMTDEDAATRQKVGDCLCVRWPSGSSSGKKANLVQKLCGRTWGANDDDDDDDKVRKVFDFIYCSTRRRGAAVCGRCIRR